MKKGIIAIVCAGFILIGWFLVPIFAPSTPEWFRTSLISIGAAALIVIGIIELLERKS